MRRSFVAFLAVLMACLCFTGRPLKVMAAETYAPYSGSLALAAEESDVDVDIAALTGAARPIDEMIDTIGTESFLSKGFTKTDLKYMAAIIYSEANSMSDEAMIAVGNVVLNRLYDSKGWPHVNTIREVIYDDKFGIQFTPTKIGADGISLMGKALRICRTMDAERYKEWQLTEMARCIKIAKMVFAGVKVIPDTYQYFNAHIDTTIERCIKNGWSFIVYDGHIYYDREGE